MLTSSTGSSSVGTALGTAARRDQPAALLEGPVGGVHRVRLAVVQGDPDAGHRVAGRDALLHLRADALFHRRDELPGHHPADDLADDVEGGRVLQRLHLDVADAVLTVPAGLLDVTAEALGLARDRLPQWHPQV